VSALTINVNGQTQVVQLGSLSAAVSQQITQAVSSASASAATATGAASTATAEAGIATAAASTATSQASAAATSATAASASAVSASASAGTATTQATNASASSASAATSATNASASAATATTQATNASTSANSAATSASASAASATASANAYSAIANGTATDAGTLNGSESAPTSRGAGLLQTTWNAAASFILGTYGVFQRAGLGAALRTILAKLFEMPFSPEDFGAVGDYNYTAGTGTDNTVALQNLLNAASVAGAEIRFKAGAKYLTGDLYAYYDATLNPGYAAKPGRIRLVGHATGIDTGTMEAQGCALVHKAGSTGTLLGILGVFSVSVPGGTGMCISIERVNLVGATTSANVLHTQDCTEIVSLSNLFIRQRNGAGYGWNSENDWGVRVDNVQIRGDDPSDGTWTGKGLYMHSDTSTGQINMWVVTNLDIYKANGIYLGRNGLSVGTFGPLVFIGGQTSYASDYGITLGAGVYNTHFLGFQVEQSRYNAVRVDSAGGSDLPRNCRFTTCYFTNNGKIADGSSNQFDVNVVDGVEIEFDKCLHQNSNSGYYFNAATAVDLHVRRPYFRTVSSYGAASGYGFNYTGSYTAQNRIHLEDAHYDQNFSSNPGPDAGAVMGYWERNIRRISYATIGATPSIGLGGNSGLASADILNFNQASAVTVTSILGGRIGQLLTVTFSNTNTTIQHNASTIFLAGGANFVPASSHSVLVLRMVYTGVWCEVGRCLV
jgi:hypothetical protein